MGDHVVLDRLAAFPRRLEFREVGQRPRRACARRCRWCGRSRASACGRRAPRRRACLERSGASAHGLIPPRRSPGRRPCRPAPRSVWKAAHRRAAPVSLPAMFIRQPRSPASSSSAPVRSIAAAFSSTIALEIAGYLTQNVPPKPQQTSLPSSGRISSPATAASSRAAGRNVQLAQAGAAVVVGAGGASEAGPSGGSRGRRRGSSVIS